MTRRRLPTAITPQAVIAAGVLLLLVSCSNSADPSSQQAEPVTTPISSPLATARQPLLKETFVDDANGWGEFNVEQGHNFFENGHYVTDFGTAPSLHWLPEALAKSWESGSVDLSNVVIETKATITRGEGVAGVFCQEQPDEDAEYEWYELVVRDGYAAIRRADMEGNLRVLAETRDLTLPANQQFSLEAVCVEGPEGVADLSLAVDGTEQLRATDTEDPLEGGLVGIQIYPPPPTADSDSPRVEWNTFFVSAA